MTDRIMAPRDTTPTLKTPGGDGLRWLPSDLIEQTCRRVGIASLVFAGVWAWVLVMNNAVWRVFGTAQHQLAMWPWPGNLLAGLGLVLSLAMVLLARRLHHRPEQLLVLGLAFEVATAFLIGALNWWHPAPEHWVGVSWICVIILVYPAIVPASARATLATALVAATMDPLWYGVAVGWGAQRALDGFAALWAFLPNYICAAIAIVPVQIIRALGRRVSRARELGAYRLGELVGRGGMGDVYRATHRLLARPAAIKLIRPEVLVRSSPDGARVIIERFRREARAAATLRSPHTIELYDFGTTDDGSFYYVMELLDGLDLQQMIERFGPLPAARAIHLLKQACLSLGEAHERGLLHRDIKPSNIVACRMGMAVDFVKILDFGLVKMDPSFGGEQLHLTSPDMTTGTPAYMAPEIAMGDPPPDRRADIYALGCVAYWLLTGETVFSAPNSVVMLMRHVEGQPVPPSARAELRIPEELDRCVLDCLAKDPEERPAHALDLYRQLSHCPVPEPWNRDQALAWWRLHLPELFPGAGGAPRTPSSEIDAPIIMDGD